jgi:hypothetical protein
LKFIRDMYKRDQKIKKALADVTVPAKKSGAKPSAKPAKTPRMPNDTQRTKGPPQTGGSKLRNLFSSG